MKRRPLFFVLNAVKRFSIIYYTRKREKKQGGGDLKIDDGKERDSNAQFICVEIAGGETEFPVVDSGYSMIACCEKRNVLKTVPERVPGLRNLRESKLFAEESAREAVYCAPQNRLSSSLSAVNGMPSLLTVPT